jgi:xanthine dehydrogenase iron-sulfur cluster and FAD-binding subunit A
MMMTKRTPLCSCRTCVKKAGQAAELKAALHFRDALGMAWYAPATLDALTKLLRAEPAATKKFVVGNTSIGVYKEQKPDMWIYIRDIPELQVRPHIPVSILPSGDVQRLRRCDRKRSGPRTAWSSAAP